MRKIVCICCLVACLAGCGEKNITTQEKELNEIVINNEQSDIIIAKLDNGLRVEGGWESEDTFDGKYIKVINEDEKVLFRSVENEELAVDNGVIKDYLNGKEILCIYTYVEDNNDADIVALFSEDSVYLDRDTSIVNLKEYYVKTNASAKIAILIFGISSPIFIITGIVLVFANKKMKNKVEQKAEPVVDYMRYAK